MVLSEGVSSGNFCLSMLVDYKGPVRWWNDMVDNAIKEKRRLGKEWKEWKEWKAGGSKESYLEAKHMVRSQVYSYLTICTFLFVIGEMMTSFHINGKQIKVFGDSAY